MGDLMDDKQMMNLMSMWSEMERHTVGFLLVLLWQRDSMNKIITLNKVLINPHNMDELMSLTLPGSLSSVSSLCMSES